MKTPLLKKLKNLTISTSLLFLLMAIVSCKNISAPNNTNLSPENLNVSNTDNESDKNSDKNSDKMTKAIVGSIDWLSVVSLNKAREVQMNVKAVGLIDIPSMDSRCTAFLVSEDMIMTNWHCFPSANDAAGARAYFDFTSEKSGRTSYKTGNSFLCEELLLTYETLDVAILKCSGKPGKAYGTLNLEEEKVDRSIGDDIYVIHQNCDYYTDTECAPTKKFSPGKVVDKGDALAPARDMDLFYDADTLGGSSGSPVFSTSSNQVIALHHNGHGITYFSNGRGDRNSGVPMGLIVNYLKNNYPEIFAKIFNRSNSNSSNSGDGMITLNQNQVNAHGGLLSRNSKLLGNVDSANDIHYYKYNQTTNGSLSITLNYDSKKRDFDLYLLSDAKNILAKSESAGDLDRLNKTLKAGTYYIAIKGYNSATGSYTLTVK
ncbi:MAG: trypsin-like peptidase domain-containing protein [Oligoflexia bacterium]|nr:trypsin-like peptidase domain-containing protein [Oligoflexia bacterium]